VTTRGFGDQEMKKIAGWFGRVAAEPTNEELAKRIRGEVKELCQGFPLYAELEV